MRDINAIEERIKEYLAFCVERDISPSIAGTASWLGTSMQVVYKWLAGVSSTPQHQAVISKYYHIMQDIWAQKMENNDINPVTGIFMGKAFYGYKDTQEVVIKTEGSSSTKLSNAELIAESKRLPGADALALPEGTQTIDADYRVLDSGEAKAAERAQRAAERKAEVEANQPIRKAAKKEYLKEYYQENAEEKYHQDRKTPEGREKYNAYMREYGRRKRAERKAAERAQKGQNAQKAE